MPLTIPAGHGLAAIHHRYTGDNEDMIVTLGARPGVPPLDVGAAERIGTAWRFHVMNQLSTALTLTKVSLRVRQDDGGDLLFEWTPPSVAGGGQTFAGAPSNVSLLVHKQTSRSGRRGRGRMFVPGITEDRVNQDGTIPGASLTAIQTAFTNFRTALGAAPDVNVTGDAVVPVLFHGNTTDTVVTRPSSTTVVRTVTTGAAGPLPDDITGLTVDSRVATQRRRLR